MMKADRKYIDDFNSC